MAIDINFGALQTPNPFGAVMEGMQQGQKLRQQQALQQAGNLFSTDPDKAAQVLASSGDIEGAARVQALAQSRKTTASRAHAAQLYSGGDVKGAQDAALASGDSDFLGAISKLSDEQKAAAQERAQSLASVGYGLSKMPYEQRRAWLASNADQVAPTVGLKPDDLRNYDPTDQNISTTVSHVLGLAKQIEQTDKDRTFGETQRHNKATEANAAARPVIVANGAVALDAEGNPIYANPKTFAPPHPAAGASLPPPPTGWNPVHR